MSSPARGVFRNESGRQKRSAVGQRLLSCTFCEHQVFAPVQHLSDQPVFSFCNILYLCVWCQSGPHEEMTAGLRFSHLRWHAPPWALFSEQQILTKRPTAQAFAGGAAEASGRCSVKVVTPASDVTSIPPPCISTMLRVIASPSPAPSP